ncbi:MAG TPA: hypothetical protein VD968_13110 [Pyrinomonadaceae bacterium]|nr:hypothetical protein [Pyrinomonadaceae bacterium]
MDDEHAEVLRDMEAALGRHGGEATRGCEAEEVAREWLAAGFDDAEEVGDWLAARCFDAEGARALEDAGLTPEQAAVRTRAGRGDYEDTVGFKVTRGDLSLEEARRIVTSDFWHG